MVFILFFILISSSKSLLQLPCVGKINGIDLKSQYQKTKRRGAAAPFQMILPNAVLFFFWFFDFVLFSKKSHD